MEKWRGFSTGLTMPSRADRRGATNRRPRKTAPRAKPPKGGPPFSPRRLFPPKRGEVSFAQQVGAPFPREETPVKMNRAGIVCAALIGLAVMVTGIHSQEKKEGAAAAAPKIMHFGDLKWTPIIKGCDLAAVSGDPSGEGTPYVGRLRCVDGAKIPAHWHPTDENVTVLKGTFLAGMS